MKKQTIIAALLLATTMSPRKDNTESNRNTG